MYVFLQYIYVHKYWILQLKLKASPLNYFDNNLSCHLSNKSLLYFIMQVVKVLSVWWIVLCYLGDRGLPGECQERLVQDSLWHHLLLIFTVQVQRALSTAEEQRHLAYVSQTYDTLVICPVSILDPWLGSVLFVNEIVKPLAFEA